MFVVEESGEDSIEEGGEDMRRLIGVVSVVMFGSLKPLAVGSRCRVRRF